MDRPKVIDADGHIYENHEEIEEYFEGKHRGMRRARAYALFPSLDGWPARERQLRVPRSRPSILRSCGSRRTPTAKPFSGRSGFSSFGRSIGSHPNIRGFTSERSRVVSFAEPACCCAPH